MRYIPFSVIPFHLEQFLDELLTWILKLMFCHSVVTFECLNVLSSCGAKIWFASPILVKKIWAVALLKPALALVLLQILDGGSLGGAITASLLSLLGETQLSREEHTAIVSTICYECHTQPTNKPTTTFQTFNQPADLDLQTHCHAWIMFWNIALEFIYKSCLKLEVYCSVPAEVAGKVDT